MKLRVFTGLAAGAAIAVLLVPRNEPRAPSPAGTVLERVLEQVSRDYVRDVDVDALWRRGIDDMVQTLDPNTRYIPAEGVDAFFGETEGSFVGIGVVLVSLPDEYPRIQNVFRPGPAATAGIEQDDMIVAVNGIDVRGIDMEELKERLHGTPGAIVSLAVRRGDEVAQRVYEVPLEKVAVSSIGAVRLYDDATPAVGYLRIQQFQNGTSENGTLAECRAALEALKAAGARALILDLRENAGGLVSQAVGVAELFLDHGVILTTRGREKEDIYRVGQPGPFVDVPLIVLQNGGSASASEFVSAALQDHHRALVVGSDSYGKWTVQTVVRVGQDNRDGLLKLTISSFHRPDESRAYRDADGELHVHPDVEVAVDEDVEQALFQAWQTEYLERINAPLAVDRLGTPSYEILDTGAGAEPNPAEDEEGGAASVVDAALIRALALLRQPETYRQLLGQAPRED